MEQIIPDYSNIEYSKYEDEILKFKSTKYIPSSILCSMIDDDYRVVVKYLKDRYPKSIILNETEGLVPDTIFMGCIPNETDDTYILI